tara:strand:- start:13980 stop:16796 length:2817 start_codon:yes stop_codon:yes gene_type:complete
MALPDLSGQNIQDTYQRLLQVSSSGQVTDGTGSTLPISFDGDNVTVAGTLTANSYVVSESITAVSSGSTTFGNDLDDIHQRTGSLRVNGSNHIFIQEAGTDGFVVAKSDYLGDPNAILLGGNVEINSHIARTAAGLINQGSPHGSLNVVGAISGGYFYFSGGIRNSELAKNLIGYDSTNNSLDFLGTHASYGSNRVQFTTDVTGEKIAFLPGGHISASGDISASNLTVEGQISGFGLSTNNISNLSQDEPYLEVVNNFDVKIGDVQETGNSCYIDIDNTNTKIAFENVTLFEHSGDTILAGALEVQGTSFTMGAPHGTVFLSGSVTASQNISSSGKFIGNELNFAGSGDGNDFIRLINNSVSIKSDDESISLTGNITASSNISSSGYIIANNYVDVKTSGTGYKLSGAKILYVDDTTYTLGRGVSATRITGSTIQLGAPGDSAHVTASGNISASGIIQGKINSSDTNVDGDHYFMVQTGTNTVPFIQNSLSLNPGTNLLNTADIDTEGDIQVIGNVSATVTGSFDHIDITSTEDSEQNSFQGALRVAGGIKVGKYVNTEHMTVKQGFGVGNQAILGTNIDSSIMMVGKVITDISSSGNINLAGNINAVGHVSASQNIRADGYLSGSLNTVFVTGSLSASGIISAENFQSDDFSVFTDAGKYILSTDGDTYITTGENNNTIQFVANDTVHATINNEIGLNVNGSISGSGDLNIQGSGSFGTNITASGNAIVGGHLTAGEIRGSTVSGDQSGSLVLSGSLTLRGNIAKPEISASTLFVHKDLDNTNNIEDLRYNTSGLSPAFSFFSMDGNGTDDSNENPFGKGGGSVTSTTHNMIHTFVDGSEGVRAYVQLDGIYKIHGTLICEASAVITNAEISLRKDGTDVFATTIAVHSSVDPVERSFLGVTSISSGSYVDVTLGTPSSAGNLNMKAGSTFMVERMA